MASRKKDWVLSEEAFKGLLASFDQDRERAARKYEEVRQKLSKFFEWAGCPFPEDCVDEAINRAARRIEEGERIQNLNSYLFGIARMVLKEAFREAQKHGAALDELPSLSQNNAEQSESEARLQCLEECLEKLAPEGRQLFVAYYQPGGLKKTKRRELAERLGIALNALRIRIHRIRATLEECVRECVKRLAAELK